MEERRNGETRGVRRSRAERVEILSAYRASGLTQEKFALEAGINLGTLRGWIYRQPAMGGEASGQFAPVRIVGALPEAKGVGTITVRWPQGIEVEIAFGADSAGAVRLVRELVAPCLR